MKSRKLRNKRPKKPKPPVRRKSSSEPAVPTDEEFTMENRQGPSSSIKQYPPASLAKSPFKVLVESSKPNLGSEQANQKEEEEEVPSSDNVVQMGLENFNETMRKNTTESGALDMEGFLNYGIDEKNDEIDWKKLTTLIVPDDMRDYGSFGDESPMEGSYSSGTDSVDSDSEKGAASLVPKTFQDKEENPFALPERPRVVESYSLNSETLAQLKPYLDKVFPSKGLTRVCIFEDCKKRSTVPCLTCEELTYCTDKHRKKGRSLHEPYCVAYRNIETKVLGRHTIAARDIDIECPIVIGFNMPLVILPMNPSLYSRKFSPTYCLKCFANKDDEVHECRTISDRKECPSCGVLNVCSRKCLHEEKWNGGGVSKHNSFECEILKRYKTEGVDKEKRYILYDQSVLGILRCIPTLNDITITNDCVQFFQLMNLIPSPREPYTKNFQSKLRLFTEVLPIDKGTLTPEKLYQLDQALLRFGRNIGPNTVTIEDPNFIIPTTYTRCIYVNLVHVIHSCVPNCLLVIAGNLMASLIATKNLKKGDVLSFCYDERFLFMSTRDRRKLLLRDFGFTCKCKRCLSQSELDTYFASFPCSKPKCKGYLVPDHPLDHFSVWFCNKCRKTPVSFLRIIDVTYNYADELMKPIREKDVLKLLDLMHDLIDGNHLHWNHQLIFNASLKLFDLLWEALYNNDPEVIEVYSATFGRKFLKPAESIINVTQAFMPNGYCNDYVLQLRFACLIKLRHLTNQLTRKETTLPKLNSSVKDMYFRTYPGSKTTLFDLPARRNNLPGTNKYIRVLESKVMRSLNKKVVHFHDNHYYVKANELWKIHQLLKKDIQELGVKADPKCGGVFPYGIIA